MILPRETKQEMSTCQEMKETVKLASSQRFRRLLPALVWNGISSSISVSFLVTWMSMTMNSDWDDDEKSKEALLAMEGFAVGEILGSFLGGYIQDKYGYKALSTYYTIMCTIACAFLIIYNEIFEFGWLAYLMTFMWGM